MSLENFTVYEDMTSTYGGAISNVGKQIMVSDTVFSANSATYYGGAIYNYNGKITFDGEQHFLGNSAQTYGGAIYNYNEDLQLSSAVFSGNAAVVNHGGAICISSGDLDLLKGTFEQNSAGGNGGAAWGFGGTLSFSNTVVAGNRAGSYGGAVYAYGADAVLNDVTVSGNSAGVNGGGIWISGGLSVTNGVFRNNTAKADGGALYNYETGNVQAEFTSNMAANGGGAIYNAGVLTHSGNIHSNTALYGGGLYNAGTATIANADFQGNSAGQNGGAILNQGDLTLNGTAVFKNNTAGYFGGAINNQSGTLSVVSGEFVSNTATNRNGGAIYNAGTGVELTNGTMSANSAGMNGGAIFTSQGELIVTNERFADNSAGAYGGAVYAFGADAVLNDVMISGNTAGANGGGVWISGGLSVTNGVFRNNTAKADGGALYNYETGNVQAEFTSNMAANGGGAIYNAGVLTHSGNIHSNTALYGGGLYNAGTATIANADFQGNSAGQNGGAILNQGDLTLNGTAVFKNNTAGYFGGAINNQSGTLSVVSGEFVSNTATNRNGGAIYNSGGGLYVTSSVMSGNYTHLHGGALYNTGGENVISALTFTGNTTGSGAGAGYYNYMGNVDLHDVVFSGTTAGTNGGGIFNAGSMTLTSGSFTGNTADVQGGALYHVEGDLIISNAIFEGNHSLNSDGGAIYAVDAVANTTIESALFTSNTAFSHGGAITNYGSLTMNEVVLSGNSALTGGALWTTGSATLTSVSFIDNYVNMDDDSNGDDNTVAAAGAFVYSGVFQGDHLLFEDNFAEWGGAGILSWDGDINLSNTTFRNNVTGNQIGFGATKPKGGGGSIHTSNGSLTVSNSLFENERCYDVGGALFVCNTETTLYDVTIDGCFAEYAVGGLCIWGGTTDITSATFTENKANGTAGALYHDQEGVLVIKDSLFSCNETITETADAGAIWNNGLLTMSSVRIVSNTTMQNGGGFFCKSGYNAISDVDFVANSAGNYGGGFHVNEGEIQLSGAVVSANIAENNGGGAFFAGGVTEMSHITFVENAATYSGGGFVNGSGAVVSMTSAVMSGNESEYFGGAVYNAGGIMYSDYTDYIGNIAATRFGGALYNGSNGSAEIDHAVISGNIAASGGGALVNSNGHITVSNTVIAGNNGGDYGRGGAVLNISNGVAAFTSVSFLGNTGGFGAAICNDKGSVTISSAVFSGNSAAETAGIFNNSNGVMRLSDIFLQTEDDTIDNYGDLTFAGVNLLGAKVKNHGSIHLDVSQVSAGNDAVCIVDNMSNIEGERNFTVIVSQEQSVGTYTLGQNADAYKGKTVSVGDGSNVYGSTSIDGNALVYNDVAYSFSVTSGSLFMTVSNNIIPPDVPDTPDVPTGIDEVVNKYNATISWDKPTLEKGQMASYVVTVNGVTTTSKSNKFKLSKLAPGEYTYQVQSVITEKGKEPVYSEWSEEYTFVVADVTAPKMGKVTGTQIDADSVSVNWTAATDNNNNVISKYVVTCNGQSKTVDGNTLTCTFDNVTGAKAAITVTAYDSGFGGTPLAGKPGKANVKIVDKIDPDQVENVELIFISNKYQGVFTWDVAEDNSGKPVKYQVCLDGNESKYINASKNTVKLSQLSVGTHTIQVRAIDSAKNEGEWSETFMFEVKDTVAPKATAIKAKVTNNDVMFSWKEPKDDVGVVGYELQYREIGSSVWDTVSFDEDEFSYGITLDKGNYEFRMTAFDDAGNESMKAGKFAVKTDLVSAFDAAPLDLMSWQDGYSAETSCAVALDSIADDWKRQAAATLLA